jgi:hypothetical protein
MQFGSVAVWGVVEQVVWQVVEWYWVASLCEINQIASYLLW